jgi:hypothetical protein
MQRAFGREGDDSWCLPHGRMADYSIDPATDGLLRPPISPQNGNCSGNGKRVTTKHGLLHRQPV